MIGLKEWNWPIKRPPARDDCQREAGSVEAGDTVAKRGVGWIWDQGAGTADKQARKLKRREKGGREGEGERGRTAQLDYVSRAKKRNQVEEEGRGSRGS